VAAEVQGEVCRGFRGATWCAAWPGLRELQSGLGKLKRGKTMDRKTEANSYVEDG